MDEAAFRAEYEAAVKNLSDEQLEQVAHLTKSKLREWVSAPERMRPHLLKKWSAPSGTGTAWEAVNEILEENAKRLEQNPLGRWAKKLGLR